MTDQAGPFKQLSSQAKHSLKPPTQPQPQTQSKPEPQKHHPLSKFNFYKWLSLS